MGNPLQQYQSGQPGLITLMPVVATTAAAAVPSQIAFRVPFAMKIKSFRVAVGGGVGTSPYCSWGLSVHDTTLASVASIVSAAIGWTGTAPSAGDVLTATVTPTDVAKRGWIAIPVTYTSGTIPLVSITIGYDTADVA